MSRLIPQGGFKRLTISELRRLAYALEQNLAASAPGSCARQEILTALAAVRVELNARLSPRGPSF